MGVIGAVVEDDGCIGEGSDGVDIEEVINDAVGVRWDIGALEMMVILL